MEEGRRGSFPYRLVLRARDGSESTVDLHYLAVPVYPEEEAEAGGPIQLDDGSWWVIEEVRDSRWAIDMWNLKPEDRLATLILRETEAPEIHEPSPLEHLVGAYFHQDWAMEAPESAGVLDLYLRENRAEDIRGARDEALELLSRCESEEEIETTLGAWHLGYWPPGDGLTYRQWVRLVVERLTETLEAKRGE